MTENQNMCQRTDIFRSLFPDLEVNRNTGKIKYLCIVDKNNERVFEWGFSDDPYIDEETEQTRRGLLL